MKFTANFCSWSHVAYFYDTTVGFWLCNKIIPTIKTISMQVFYCILREFCRSWLALINAPQTQASMQRHVAAHRKALAHLQSSSKHIPGGEGTEQHMPFSLWVKVEVLTRPHIQKGGIVICCLCPSTFFLSLYRDSRVTLQITIKRTSHLVTLLWSSKS